MISDSDTALATQQSIKAYVDGLTDDRVGGTGTAEQVAFWTSETEIGGAADLTFDGDVLAAPSGEFTTLTTETLATGLTPGRLVWTGADELLSVDDALAYTATDDKVTLTSDADTGQAFQIVADSLTSGEALDISSTGNTITSGTLIHLDTTGNDSGSALHIEHESGITNPEDSAVYIDRNNNGRALTIEGDVSTQYMAYLTDQNSITSGNILRLHAGNTAFTDAGSVLYVDTASNQSGGKGITVIQRGTGDGIYVSKSDTAAIGMAARFKQETDSGDGDLDDDEGGAVHIFNNQPNYALTIYSPTGLNPDNPLVTYRAASASFDQPILELYPAAGSEAPPLYMHALSGAPDGVEGGPQLGMLYVNSTNNNLYFYNGADWIALTGSAGGAGDFATRALDNLDSVAINADLIPDGNNTRDLGSGAASWKDLYVAGTATIATVDITSAAITAGEFTNLTGDSVTVSGISPEQVVYAGTGGVLQGDANLTFDGTVLSGNSGDFTTLTANTVALDSYGDAATPPLSFDDDPGMGMFRAADNVLAFATNGAEKLRIYSSGGGDDEIAISGGGTETIRFDADNYVGIGTGTSIDAKLHVETTGVDALKVKQDGASNGIFVDQNGADNAVFIDQGANTGSDTPSDTAGGALHIYNRSNTGAAITVYDNTASPVMPLLWLRAGDNFTDQPMIRLDRNAGAESLLVNNESAVSADEVLGQILFDSDDDNCSVSTVDASVMIRAYASETHDADNKGGYLTFETKADDTGPAAAATERMRITSSGTVGIGTDSPNANARMSVAGSSGSLAHLHLAPLDEEPSTASKGDFYADTDGSVYAHNDAGFNALDSRWTFQEFTRASDSTFTVTDNAANQAIFRVGVPIRYADTVGNWRYGMVTDYAGGTVTLSGAEMTTDFDAYLQTGNPEMLRQANFYKPGEIEDGDNFMGLATWQMSEGYVVRATGQLETAADGDDALVAIGIGGAGTDLITGAGQLDLGTSTDQVATTTDIDTDNYNITFEEQIFVNVDQVGSTSPGEGLLVTLQVITP